jgi:hypothetical protein
MSPFLSALCRLAYSVAHDVVDARAHALRKTLVVERCRARTLPDRILVHDPVDLLGRHPCADLVTDEQ